VTPVINAARFRTRWKHYEDFEKHVAESGAILYTIEVAFGDRDFVVTQPGKAGHIQMRTHHELWLKERAINLCVQRLPMDAKYIAWVDADCTFARHDWADETRHQLQHYPIVQMWSQLSDVDPSYEVVNQLRSFMDVQISGATKKSADVYGYGAAFGVGQNFGSPGLAWACHRDVWSQIGGLLDICIMGAGDWYFAQTVMGKLEAAISTRNDLTPAFIRRMKDYAMHVARAKGQGRAVMGNCGVMKGLVVHYWHGGRSKRQYNTRGEILSRNGFDPDKDLQPDWQGLYQLTDRSTALRRDIQTYFAQRNEDQL
jgi:hypothetical protein